MLFVALILLSVYKTTSFITNFLIALIKLFINSKSISPFLLSGRRILTSFKILTLKDEEPQEKLEKAFVITDIRKFAISEFNS